MSDEQRIAEVVEALEAGNLGCLAEGADCVAGADWWRGRKEIRAKLKTGPCPVSSVAIRFLRSDVAVVHVRGAAGIGTLVLGRSRGRWLVEALQVP